MTKDALIDPMLSLAMSMESRPGAYALLLGSGVSRSAGVLTGWDIVVDLTRRLADLMGQDYEPDPASWYEGQFGSKPDYAQLLDELTHTPTERQQLLRSYFEPSAEEREQGLKQPTAAHRAIAKLAAHGYVKLIVTVNFDRLIEQALEKEGLTPAIISTPDAAKGALPLVHQTCCVIKLHGDYLDTRIRNTEAELASYPAEMNQLLADIFDDFGMVICGWSAQWDTALRAAVERCEGRRFSWFWMTQGALTEEAKKLIGAREARVLNIQDADSAFNRLNELVTGVAESKRPHPTATSTAVALLKRYLPDPVHRVRLYDLVIDEAEAVHERLCRFNHDNAVETGHVDAEGIYRGQREILTTLHALGVHGAALGIEEQDFLWVDALQRISRPPKAGLKKLPPGYQHCPAAVLLYSIGLVATAMQKHSLLAAILTRPTAQVSREPKPLVIALDWLKMNEGAQTIQRYQGHCFALSDYLFDCLQDDVRRYVTTEKEYKDFFDRFEYLRGLVFADLYDRVVNGKRYGPVGRFARKVINTGESAPVMRAVEDELEAEGNKWLCLQHGLFGGSIDRFRQVKSEYDNLIMQMQWE